MEKNHIHNHGCTYGSDSHSSAAEIATPGDADQTGYVKIEAKLPESDKKGEDVTGIVYEVYKDASCKDEVPIKEIMLLP